MPVIKYYKNEPENLYILIFVTKGVLYFVQQFSSCGVN